ncbi:hypothetical protein GCK72_012015 [Caenorhabditis remanei]|uniref:Uncharacterized protein n=1 Tax=Caenorhabditis remanei TaxID=31234 RepID=A0A6A5GLZ9_CAERE|nr:hypothetical protein GCK72_012015 [Caenorhabditis remanei]KAF1755565.1 hypothetical protein GCK72_012015 [Caenorhabditis remanei]
MIAGGTLSPMVDLINLIKSDKKLFQFGPAANMHKLKWSRHLEQHAYLHMKEKGFNITNIFTAIDRDGLVGFIWSGTILKLAEEVIKLIPIKEIKYVLKPLLDIIDLLLTAVLLLYNYPGEKHITNTYDLGASNALFAHRYEIGCYGKMMYTVCMMENSTNGGQFYQRGMPCTNCTTGYCEFHEDENGYIEEGDLCEPPKESLSDYVNTFAPSTSTIRMKTPKPRRTFWKSNFFVSASSILFSLAILVTILLEVLDLFGPATKMYKLVWSRQLELVSYEYSTDNSPSNDSSGLFSIHYKDHVGFYWFGDLTVILELAIKVIPIDEFKKIAKDIMDALEGFLMVYWIMISALEVENPLKRNTYYGAAELLYGDRYEIGCHSNWVYSVCFLKKMEYQPWFFDVGVSCFGCQGQCEFWMSEKDGEYEEGDLCVPPKDFYTKQIAEKQQLIEATTNASMQVSIMILFILVLFFNFRR